VHRTVIDLDGKHDSAARRVRISSQQCQRGGSGGEPGDVLELLAVAFAVPLAKCTGDGVAPAGGRRSTVGEPRPEQRDGRRQIDAQRKLA
jgi:hypothetical protein